MSQPVSCALSFSLRVLIVAFLFEFEGSVFELTVAKSLGTRLGLQRRFDNASSQGNERAIPAYGCKVLWSTLRI